MMMQLVFSANILVFILSELVQNYIWFVSTLLMKIKSVDLLQKALGQSNLKRYISNLASLLAFGIFHCVNIIF